ncbi:MAG: cellulase family glycosylhydrolase [Anaerolineae bacterium]
METSNSLATAQLDAPLDFTPKFTVSLPIVMRNHRYRLPCTLESPFSIEIAAISDVIPDDTSDATERAMAKIEWQERVEEGYPSLVQALADSGACWTRIELKWRQIQPEPPPAPYSDYDLGWFDERLQLIADAGIQIIAVVHDAPYWAAEESTGPIYPEQVPAFAQFLTDMVGRYKQSPYNIHHWQLWNEPDQTEKLPYWPGGYGFDGDLYADMLAHAYPAIKAVDPGATVLMGGIAYDFFEEYGDGPFNRYFPDDVMDAGGGSYMDATSFHYFPDFYREWERWNIYGPPTCGDVHDGLGDPYFAGGIDLVAKTSHFYNRMRVCAGVDKPIWITEMGQHGREGDLDSLGQQANYVLQGYARALAMGVKNITWFVLVSPWYDAHQQGLLYEDDWSPKPAFFTYQTMVYELTDYRYSRTLDVPKVEGYAFRNDLGQEQVVAWSWGEELESGSLTFAPANVLRVVDREGQVTYIQDGGWRDADDITGSVTIRLPAVPVDPDPTDDIRNTAEPLIISKW